MISLYSKACKFFNWEEGAEPLILPVTENPNLPKVVAKKYALVCDRIPGKPSESIASYGAILSRGLVKSPTLNRVIQLSAELSYIKSSDIVRLNPGGGEVRTLFRSDSDHNSILVTERCNSFCLMCSQPPREIDDSYLIEDACEVIKKIPRSTRSLGITGGEPTLLGEGFLRIVRSAARYLPETHLHVLTNGRTFSQRVNSVALKDVGHPNLVLGIPLYSDLPERHDFVVQAAGAFEETIRGIMNLRRDGQNIELRVVIHKQTYARLPELARFIVRNLAFVEHVAFMGLEITGFTKANFGALWIDPYEYRSELDEACRILQSARVKTMLYNHQLCILTPFVRELSVNSISDWKNDYLEKCAPCDRKNDCGGFFSTGFSLEKTSNHISPFISSNRIIPFEEIA